MKAVRFLELTMFMNFVSRNIGPILSHFQIVKIMDDDQRLHLGRETPSQEVSRTSYFYGFWRPVPLRLGRCALSSFADVCFEYVISEI